MVVVKTPDSGSVESGTAVLSAAKTGSGGPRGDEPPPAGDTPETVGVLAVGAVLASIDKERFVVFRLLEDAGLRVQGVLTFDSDGFESDFDDTGADVLVSSLLTRRYLPSWEPIVRQTRLVREC